MCTYAYVEADFRSEGRNERPQVTVCHDEVKLRDTVDRLSKNPQVLAVRIYPCAQTISKKTELIVDTHLTQAAL